MVAPRITLVQSALLIAAGAMIITAASWGGCHNGQPHRPAGSQTTAPVPPEPRETQAVTIAGETFQLELALTDDERYQGLSDRPAIAPDGGMLFVFPEPDEQSFVMRRCLVPIDLLYVSSSGEIVSMHEMEKVPYNTPEWRLKRYHSGWPAQFVIELAEGSIDRLGVKVGDKVEMPLNDLKDRAR